MLSFVPLLLCVAFPSVLSTPLARGNPDCLPTNNIGASLVNQSRDGNFTSCTYSSEVTPCTYFLGGDFSSGSSNCPSPSIIGSGTKTAITVMDFLCLALNLNASAGADGSQLERATNISDAVIQCEYFDGTDGSRQDGVPNVCPSSIDPDKNKETDSDCDELDLQQSLLIGSSMTVAGNLACAYGDGALCKYSTNGTLSFGDGLCVGKILFGFKRPGTRPRTSQDHMVFSGLEHTVKISARCSKASGDSRTLTRLLGDS
ncbi:hypothetical protein C8R43DRAFT_1137014 [Mycena crocata]|nr:hypothetical protein C8R43DRAFT_1137014 [Mycena crocata]